VKLSGNTRLEPVQKLLSALGTMLQSYANIPIMQIQAQNLAGATKVALMV